MANPEGIPSAVLKAFNCSSDPQKLEGGEGRSYQVGDLVLKPVDDIVRYEWAAELLTHLQSSEIRIAVPQRTDLGAFTYLGWGATHFERRRNSWTLARKTRSLPCVPAQFAQSPNSSATAKQ